MPTPSIPPVLHCLPKLSGHEAVQGLHHHGHQTARLAVMLPSTLTALSPSAASSVAAGNVSGNRVRAIKGQQTAAQRRRKNQDSAKSTSNKQFCLRHPTGDL